MEPPVFYNPCKDGFPAKAWECLRRNESFFRLVASYLTVPDGERWPQTQLIDHAEKTNNRFAVTAFEVVAWHGGVTENRILPWPALATYSKEKLERFLDAEMGSEIPMEVTGLDCEEAATGERRYSDPWGQLESNFAFACHNPA